ncbi:MAG TPA: hypothetical protein VL171_00685 [Verrucomicrobiae bacterium]|nr:hypothetical protein [Verrucomicrobiae bacterium]
MAETKTDYRALPSVVEAPQKLRRLTESEFAAMKKTQMQTVQSLCDGHEGTVVWYNEQEYVVQIKLRSRPDVYVVTPCTFTPTFGMDRIDGMFAEDAEAYVLQSELGYPSKRLAAFEGRDSLDIENYLANRGMPVSPAQPDEKVQRKWWQFWK